MPTAELFDHEPKLCECGCGETMENCHGNRKTVPGHYPKVRNMKKLDELEKIYVDYSDRFNVLIDEWNLDDAIESTIRLLDYSNVPRSRWSGNYFMHHLRVWHNIPINNNMLEPLTRYLWRGHNVELTQRKKKRDKVREKI